MRSDLTNPNYNITAKHQSQGKWESEMLKFLHSIEGKDIWFKALMDWMYYLRVLSISPDEKSVTVEYYDCDNPDQYLLKGYDSMEVYIDEIDIEVPLELITTEELEEVKAMYESEYERYLRENGVGDYGVDYEDL